MDVKSALIIALPIVSAILLIDIGLNVTEHFVSGGTISKTAIWTLIGSFTGATVSFFLLVLWDKYKDRKFTKQKDEIILHSIGHELDACLLTCNSCVQFLDSEIDEIDTSGSYFVLPPPVPKLEIWELLKYHIPPYIKNKPDTLYHLRMIENRVANFNNELRSREEFRNNNRTLASNGMTKGLKLYDSSLVDNLNNVLLLMIKPLRDEFSQFLLDKQS